MAQDAQAKTIQVAVAVVAVLVVALLAARVPIIQIAFLLPLTAAIIFAKIPFHAGDALSLSKILNRGR